MAIFCVGVHMQVCACVHTCLQGDGGGGGDSGSGSNDNDIFVHLEFCAAGK